MAELFPVNELRSRYGIGKQADINRRKHLGIKPIKVEGNYYVTKEQLDRLDALHQYLQQNPGAKMSSHFSLDMHVLKGPDCPANEPAVGERVSDRERPQLREQPLLELLQAGKIQSLEPRFELLP
ncbi:MAG: hypothetical protein BRC35_08265 [Cyanobacteria bacterium QH_10_48_56]|nr:MAG: hypothetical protein BRC35_08265 [Cyanobacteria bacterium QH_10_48_56]